MNVIVIMGVAGAGKTLIGSLLAAEIGWVFYDGDDYHSAVNIQKMARGEGLTDRDRAPWLNALHRLVSDVVMQNSHAVLACSALKERYRDRLMPRDAAPRSLSFVFLDVPQTVLAERLAGRVGHFAPPDLLPSQLATLEVPEDALRVDGTLPPGTIVQRIRDALDV